MTPRVVRLRALTPGQVQRLEALRRVARMLDSSIQVPGSTYRVGLDPILGLIPGLGDLVSPIFTIALLWQGHDLGIPKVVQARMVINVAIDTLIGMVPLLGDLFDFAWKSNEMNMTLLETHAYEERRASAGDWLFVGAMILTLVVVAVLPFVAVGWALGRLFGLLAGA